MDDKLKILYHGSPRKLIGNKLLPKQAKDIDKTLENNQKGIYATDIKNIAILKALVSSKGVHGASFASSKKGVYGIIYKGWPNQKQIYLHYVPYENFQQTGENTHQYISKKPVKPIKTEILKIKDYLYLIRKASEQEMKKELKI